MTKLKITLCVFIFIVLFFAVTNYSLFMLHRDKMPNMKIKLQTQTFLAPTFDGTEATPNYTDFGLTADNFFALETLQQGNITKLKLDLLCSGSWFSQSGSKLIELSTVPLLDLKGKSVAGVPVRDTITHGLILIKTPHCTHQVFVNEQAKNITTEGGIFTFSAKGNYEVSLLFATMYRTSTLTVVGEAKLQYHVFSANFSVGAEGAPNAIDGTSLKIDDVLRLDHRTKAVEVQKRLQDFYYWTDCVIQSMKLTQTTPTGQKYYTVTYTYKNSGTISEQVKEDVAPNFSL